MIHISHQPFRIRRLLVIAILCLAVIHVSGQTRVRTEINIPDIPGYHTLKCDFHMHSVFSDGDVWPTVRVEEAWREGLDAIALTEHIEKYHYAEVKADHNRAFEIASSRARQLDILLIRGAEITRDMPPGHFNAIFIRDANALDQENFQDAVEAAILQGGFVFWNHPGWKGQQSDGVSRWYPIHDELLEKGWMHGIEIVNEREYYPTVHQWCIDKNLTLMGNSDIHAPANLFFDFPNGDHRTMTLVFATDHTETAILEALRNRRTAVYAGNMLYGDAQYLKAIFNASIEMRSTKISITGKGRAYAQILNKSDIDLHLKTDAEFDDLTIPREITLPAGRTTLFTLRSKSECLSGNQTIEIPYVVQNMHIAPDQGLPVKFTFQVQFHPEEE